MQTHLYVSPPLSRFLVDLLFPLAMLLVIGVTRSPIPSFYKSREKRSVRGDTLQRRPASSRTRRDAKVSGPIRGVALFSMTDAAKSAVPPARPQLRFA